MIKPLRFVVLATAVAFFLPASATAQFAMPKDVVGSGGTDASSTSFGIRGTVGQSAIGLTAGDSFSKKIGYWYGPGMTVTAIGDRDDRPVRVFRLHQNHPNPFNPTTTIRFDLPERAHARIVVYDAAGRRVMDLVDEELGPGVHRVTFDARHLASGVYFYRIQAGSFTDVKKLVLLK